MRNSLTMTPIALTGAAVAGVALGFATQTLQGSLGGSSAVLANSGAVWVLVAFALGLVMPTSPVAAIGGAMCLVAASISFYIAVDWFEGIASSPRGPVVWSITGIVAGAAFGLAGFRARHSTQHRRSAWALLAGVLIGEGIHTTWYVGNDQLRPAGIAELAIAAIISLLILRRAKSGALVAATIAAAAVVTLFAVSLINRVFAAF
jgi:Family of unknown function (DUF6518)